MSHDASHDSMMDNGVMDPVTALIYPTETAGTATTVASNAASMLLEAARVASGALVPSVRNVTHVYVNARAQTMRSSAAVPESGTEPQSMNTSPESMQNYSGTVYPTMFRRTIWNGSQPSNGTLSDPLSTPGMMNTQMMGSVVNRNAYPRSRQGMPPPDAFTTSSSQSHVQNRPPSATHMMTSTTSMFRPMGAFLGTGSSASQARLQANSPAQGVRVQPQQQQAMMPPSMSMAPSMQQHNSVQELRQAATNSQQQQLGRVTFHALQQRAMIQHQQQAQIQQASRHIASQSSTGPPSTSITPRTFGNLTAYMTDDNVSSPSYTVVVNNNTRGLTNTTGRYNGYASARVHPSFRTKSVCFLKCRFCNQEICMRGMKAILLADTRVELYSTDVVPAGRVQLVADDYMTRNCHCRIRDVACLGCGNVVGYHVTQPCELCMSACNNGHFWMFHSDTVEAQERIETTGRALLWGQLPNADIDGSENAERGTQTSVCR